MIVTVDRAEETEEARSYEPFGNAKKILYCRDPEIILSGPAGTGKSRACLERLLLIAEKYPRCRILIIRKTRASLTDTALVTWEEKVVPEGHPCLVGPGRENRRSYKFPNGSSITIGGLDKATRIMSTEFDVIYVQEAIELTEAEWEALTSRLRNNKLPYQLILGDTNPDAPTHWIKNRESRGTLTLMESRHQDNPLLWDAHHKCPTEFGKVYLARLGNLTGIRKKRLGEGLWVQAEGVVYETWDPHIHRITANTLPMGWRTFERIWVVDFGYTNPFVWQEWVRSPDGVLYRIREIYRTRRLVQDHCADINAVTGWKVENGRRVKARDNADPNPVVVVCDHDAEDRATFERHTGLKTEAANKEVSNGIQAVAARLGKPADGVNEAVPPRLFYVRDGLIHAPDPDLLEKLQPTCTEEEYDSYIWDLKNKQKKGESPVKKFDHGQDATRYVVAWADEIHRGRPRPRFRPIGT